MAKKADVQWARDLKKQAQQARDEYLASLGDSAAKHKAAAEAHARTGEAKRQVAERSTESRLADADATLAEIAKSPDAKALRKAADEAEKTLAEAEKRADELDKADDIAQKAADDAAAVVAAKKVLAEAVSTPEDLADLAIAAAEKADRQAEAAERQAAARAAKQAAERDAARDRPEVGQEKEVELDAGNAADVRAEATATRAAMQEEYEEKAGRITEARDEVARDQWSHEQSVKAAEMQIKREQRVVVEAKAKIERLNRDADSLDTKDPDMANALREQAQRTASDLRVAEGRIAKAQEQIEHHQSLADGNKRSVEDMEEKYRELQLERDAAEKAVDGLEERAKLLESANAKLAEAERTGNDALRKEAEALVERAERVHVDRAAIKRVTPDESSSQNPANDTAPASTGTDTTPQPGGETPQAGGEAPKPTVNPEKVAFIREEIAKGNHVSIGPDGVPASIEPRTPPTPEQIQKNLEAFDKDVSSGKFNDEMAKGNSYTSNPDGTGGYTEPEPATDGQEGSDSGAPVEGPELSAAELRDLTEKYGVAAQAVHQQRVDAKMPDEGFEKSMDTRLELKGLNGQLEETSKVQAEWPKEIKAHQDNAARLEKEATRLEEQGKSREAEEKREEAALEAGTAKGLERGLEEVSEREAVIKARVLVLQKENLAHAEGAPARKQRQEQLEVTADKLDDVARTMGEAYRAKLEADELVQQADQATDPAQKLQLEAKAAAAAAQARQLAEKARQLVPKDNPTAQEAMKGAGIPVATEPPPVAPPTAPEGSAPPAVPADGAEQATQDGTGAATSTTDASADTDTVGDEGTDSGEGTGIVTRPASTGDAETHQIADADGGEASDSRLAMSHEEAASAEESSTGMEEPSDDWVSSDLGTEAEVETQEAFATDPEPMVADAGIPQEDQQFVDQMDEQQLS